MYKSCFKALLFFILPWYTLGQFKRAPHPWKFESCDQANGDGCAQRIYLFGYREIGVNTSAQNIKEMKDYCLETREAEKCTKDWSKNCLTSFERQCLNLLVSGAAQSRRSLCTAKGQQSFLQNRECFIKTVNSQHDCMDEFKTDINSVLDINSDEFGFKLRTGCCFADKWLKCFRRSAKKVCDNKGLKFLEWVVYPYVVDALDLGCRKDWTYGADICNKTIKQIPVQLSGVRNTTKSIMFPLYSILSHFGETQSI